MKPILHLFDNDYLGFETDTPYEYKHVFGKDFVPNISIMDLLFSEGPNSLEIINNSDSFEINPI